MEKKKSNYYGENSYYKNTHPALKFSIDLPLSIFFKN
jgi:hypothetical protein